MSTASSESDYVPDYHTSNARFQRKLLEAQQSAEERQIEDDLDLLDVRELPDSEEQLEEEREALLAEVQEVEQEVASLRQQLAHRKARRLREATISNMTPEERAKAVEEEEQMQEEDDVDNLDVIFDYLLYVGGVPLPKNAADMSGSDMITPHAELRAKVKNDPEVQRQSEFTHIQFTQTENRLVRDDVHTGETRECELTGTCYELPFHLAFEVTGPNYTVSNLTFELSIVMQLETAPVLQQIKDECDLLAFFRLLVHYARLVDQRKSVFEELKDWAERNHLQVEAIADDRLRFEKEDDAGPSLILSWTTMAQPSEKEDVGVNICERVLPDIQIQLDSCK